MKAGVYMMTENHTVKIIRELYDIEGDCELVRAEEHWGGRNLVYICRSHGEPLSIVRVSATGDRREEDYLAETEYVHYLAEGGAAVADVIPSKNSRLVEKLAVDGTDIFISRFEYAKGILLADNGYRYREGHPLSEYFHNIGAALGRIHALSKKYQPKHRRADYFDKYNMSYIDCLISDSYAALKRAMANRIEKFMTLPRDDSSYGLVHFDYSDGNYHIDMSSGKITVFDFDNSMYCWYMFDLANLWTHGEGWCMGENDPEKRRAIMNDYFSSVLDGYKEETDLSEEMLKELPLFIDMVLIENIVDEFECCRRAGEEVDYEDIEDAAECLVNNIPFAGIIEV